MSPLTIKNETQPAAAELVEGFRQRLADAEVDRDDDAAVFNAACDFSQEHGLSVHRMKGVLVALFQRNDVRAEAIRMWIRDAPAVLKDDAKNIADAVANASLLAHGATVAGWAGAPVLDELGTWYQRFNDAFFGGALPPAAISIEPANVRTLGSYRPGRDGFGLRYHINVNAVHLDNPLSDRLETLLHEAVHLWEEVTHGRRETRGNYHSARFREMAKKLGIPSDERGRSTGIHPTGRFASLLKHHGVEVAIAATSGSRPRRPATSSLVRWSCACPVNIWAARGTEVNGRCDVCTSTWQRSVLRKEVPNPGS